MKIDGFVKFLLLVIAIFLGIIALRPYLAPPVVEAQSSGAYPVYFAPSAVMLSTPNGGSSWGRVAIDLRNGNVRGFPGFTQDTFGAFDKTLPTSHPMLLGKLALADMDK
jgi:hypothetical protein